MDTRKSSGIEFATLAAAAFMLETAALMNAPEEFRTQESPQKNRAQNPVSHNI
jgi:hypothetical protein